MLDAGSDAYNIAIGADAGGLMSTGVRKLPELRLSS